MRCALPRFNSIKLKFFTFLVLILTVYLFLLYVFTDVLFSKRSAPEMRTVVLPYVVLHIDLKGSPPKLEYLESLLPVLKYHGVNGLLMEYEDMFPYQGKLINISASNCYSKQDLSHFISSATESGFEVIPLVQTFGHLEHMLKLQEFSRLREAPLYPDSICPTKLESRAVVRHMLEQVVKFHNAIAPLKHIHVGCDEVFHMNMCAQCASKGLTNVDLFIDYVRFVSDTVRALAPDATMLIWDDMLRTIKPLEWKRIDCFNNVEPVYWDYAPSLRVSHITLHGYHKKFSNIWAASAFKGADGRTASLPNLRNRALNHFNWMKLMLDYKFGGEEKIFGFKGIILTGWSRYSHMDPLCELLPASIPSLLLNLLTVKTFKSGLKNVNVDYDDFYIEHLRSNLEFVLKCKDSVDFESFDPSVCNFDGQVLYQILKQYVMLSNDVANSFHYNERSLENIEYYSKFNQLNKNTALENYNHYCNYTSSVLQGVEKSLNIELRRHYKDDFIDEYVKYKMYGLKKKLDTVCDLLYSYMFVRVWKRNPVCCP